MKNDKNLQEFRRIYIRNLMSEKDGKVFKYLADDAERRVDMIISAITDSQKIKERNGGRKTNLKGISEALDKTIEELHCGYQMDQIYNFFYDNETTSDQAE